MTSTTIPSSHRDLLEAPIAVSLSTVGPDGLPQVTAIWAILVGEKVLSSFTAARQKFKNLMLRPRATVFVIDPANPYRTLEIRGEVSIEPDPDLITLKMVLAGYGTDLDRFQGPLEDRATITLHPSHVVAQG
jgi:PPOX class probable F420-dependent enzyme